MRKDKKKGEWEWEVNWGNLREKEEEKKLFLTFFYPKIQLNVNILSPIIFFC